MQVPSASDVYNGRNWGFGRARLEWCNDRLSYHFFFPLPFGAPRIGRRCTATHRNARATQVS